MPTTGRVSVRRVYETPGEHEGARILVDRLWPRGLSHADVGEDAWAKDAAPSSQLRTWFHAHPDDLAEFERRYRDELTASGAAVALARELKDTERITLLYAARDPRVNHASVLAAVLEEHL